MPSNVLLRVYTGRHDGILRWVCPKCGSATGGGDAGSGTFHLQRACRGCGGKGYVDLFTVLAVLRYFENNPRLKTSKEFNQQRQYDSLVLMAQIYFQFPEKWRELEYRRGEREQEQCRANENDDPNDDIVQLLDRIEAFLRRQQANK